MAGTPKISMKNVKKSFGAKVVLDGFDADIAPGESRVIIGGSGTGKSVTIKCIQGLLMPESGSIRIDGTEMTDLSTRGRDRINADMGMLFQNAALFDSMTVWENVVFGLMKRRKMKPVEARDIAVEKLKLVGLGPDAAALYPAELSGGMKKRVGLARAIATEPKIIFFDEPTTGLDPIMSDVINNLIVDCVKRLGATAVTITHDMVSAGKIADNITMLYKGKNIWTGPADGVRHADNPYVDQFVNGRADGPIRLA